MYAGLTPDQIEKILLSKGIKEGEVVSAAKQRSAIAAAIEENNRKLLNDILEALNGHSKK